MEWIRQSIVTNPNNAAAHSNLGEAYRATGRLEEAIAAYRRAAELKPDYTEAYNNLGLAFHGQGRLREAEAACLRAVELSPNHPIPWNSLGIILAGLGKFNEAEGVFRRALELRPDYPEAYLNLSNLLRLRGQLDEAVAAARRALVFQPDYAEARVSLGNALKEQGLLDEAIAAYREALRLHPENAGVHSNLVYALHFQPRHDDRTIAEEQARWSRRFCDASNASVLRNVVDRTANRRLRIGYVSGHFRDHVVGRNLWPLFENLDHENFETLCYADVAEPDELTERFRQCAGQWRNTVGVPDATLADMIRRDGVDILVDLTLHLGANRLPVFGGQPAPVQVSFAGYPGSAGLPAIEHRISDRHLEWNVVAADSYAAAPAPVTVGCEQVYQLDSFWCFDPGEIEVEVNELPALQSGRITFGSLNNFCKINEPVLKLWAQVLRKVEDSRLILLSGAGSHRDRTRRFLQQEGVAEHRVEFVDRASRRAYLEMYHRLDIVLDPFPYHGHTTSLDALWMGVPVVSLAGQTPVSRAGLSILTNLGLPELVARSEREYFKVAVELAGGLPRLAALRAQLRSRMEKSPLMDAPRFARSIEAAYRTMWRRWCAR